MVFLARTNALVEQQFNLFQKYIPDKKVSLNLKGYSEYCSHITYLLDIRHTFAIFNINFVLRTTNTFSIKIYHLHTATKECLGMNLVFEDHHVFFLTPQILLNNINNKRIRLSDVSLLIFDECHHTRKREPYNNVMKQYLTMKRKEKKVPQVTVFTFMKEVNKKRK